MSFLKLLESSEYFYLPAIIDDSEVLDCVLVVSCIGVKIRDKFTHKFYMNYSHLNMPIEKNQFVKVKVNSNSEKMGGGDYYNSTFDSLISEDEYNNIYFLLKHMLEKLSVTSINKIVILRDSQKIHALNEIRVEFQKLQGWHCIEDNYFDEFLEKMMLESPNYESSALLKEKEEDLTRRAEQISKKEVTLNSERKAFELKKSRFREKEKKFAASIDFLNRVGLIPKATSDEKTSFMPLSGEKYQKALAYPSSDLVEKAFQLALMSAVIRGRLILLEGSVGVGKTHLAESFSKRLGGKCATIPVRPSWTDSSDLFGFFDPLSKVFRPAAFTEALAQDQEPVDQDSKRAIYPVILDEMNLARIENYGADLLSRVEKIAEYKIQPEKDRQEGDDSYLLKVWSEFEYQSLDEERKNIEQMTDKKPENKRRLSELNFLDVYTPKMSLPEGFVLMGTLNADESTFEISPKVIDRSFVITFPNFNGQKNIEDFLYNFNVSEFREEFIKWSVKNTNHQEKWETFYKKIKLIDELGIPISYRIYNDYCDMMVFLDLGLIPLKDKQEYEQAFIWSRIIPRISFFKDQDAKKAALNTLLALLSNNKSDLAWKGIEDKLKKQITDDNVSMVKFFGC